MAGKELKIHNKSDKPNNIVEKEARIFQECEDIERQLPSFLRGFFLYLKGNVLPMSRLAYLHDLKFFFNYLVNETGLTDAEVPCRITLAEMQEIKAIDINLYLDYCRKYKVETEKNIYIYENNNKTLARKKSSVSVMFKHLYRDGLLSENITDGFDPIRVPKAGEREIKALQDMFAEIVVKTNGEVVKGNTVPIEFLSNVCFLLILIYKYNKNFKIKRRNQYAKDKFKKKAVLHPLYCAYCGICTYYNRL